MGATAVLGHQSWVVDYVLPDGPEADRALEAVEVDYRTAPPPGVRIWSPGQGWISQCQPVSGIDRSGNTGERWAEGTGPAAQAGR